MLNLITRTGLNCCGRQGDQSNKACAALGDPKQGNGVAHLIALHKHALNILELDRLAAQHHPVLQATDEGDAPVGIVAGQIARPQESRLIVACGFYYYYYSGVSQ